MGAEIIDFARGVAHAAAAGRPLSTGDTVWVERTQRRHTIWRVTSYGSPVVLIDGTWHALQPGEYRRVEGR